MYIVINLIVFIITPAYTMVIHIWYWREHYWYNLRQCHAGWLCIMRIGMQTQRLRRPLIITAYGLMTVVSIVSVI